MIFTIDKLIKYVYTYIKKEIIMKLSAILLLMLLFLFIVIIAVVVVVIVAASKKKNTGTVVTGDALHCSSCGNIISSGTQYCPYCGTVITNTIKSYSPNTSDAPSAGFAVLGFFFPLIGLILYLVWKDQSPLKAKSCGKGALAGIITGVIVSILLTIFYLIFYSWFIAYLANI